MSLRAALTYTDRPQDAAWIHSRTQGLLALAACMPIPMACVAGPNLGVNISMNYTATIWFGPFEHIFRSYRARTESRKPCGYALDPWTSIFCGHEPARVQHHLDSSAAGDLERFCNG
eukprot:5926151-Prymnesium_polylepis.1